MSEIAIELDRIGKVFPNGTIALQQVNLAVRRGEFVSLLGASGCGKSTVLKIIAGLISPTSGSLRWHIDAPRLAFVFQDAALLPWSTVWGNVRLPLKLSGVSKKEGDRRVREAIERVGLLGFENAYPRQLSGGMKMRASIARALVTQPDVMLLDEPFGALDEITRTKLNDELASLWQQMGWTVVFVTHNTYEAVYLSDRVAVMGGKRIASEVPVEVPHPRGEDFRTSNAYSRYRQRIGDALSKAMTASEMAI